VRNERGARPVFFAFSQALTHLPHPCLPPFADNRYAPFDAVTNDVDNAAVSADGHTYTQPKYMITIVSGASGDVEKDDSCGAGGSPSITCSENYGWGILVPVNATVATWTFHTVTADGPGPRDYADSLTIVSDHRVSRL
jgi:hypothetical protein